MCLVFYDGVGFFAFWWVLTVYFFLSCEFVDDSNLFVFLYIYFHGLVFLSFFVVSNLSFFLF